MISFKQYVNEMLADEPDIINPIGVEKTPVTQDYNINPVKVNKDGSIILAKKQFSGKVNNLEVKLVRYTNDNKPRIEVNLLNDPKIMGYVEYDYKIDSIVAFNSITDITQVLKYMENYISEPNSYKFALMLKDEGVKEEKGVEGASAFSPTPETGMPPMGGMDTGSAPPPETPPMETPGAAIPPTSTPTPEAGAIPPTV